MLRWLSESFIFIGLLLLLSPVLAESYTNYQQKVLLSTVNYQQSSNSGASAEEDPTVSVPEEVGSNQKIVPQPLQPPFVLNIPSIAIEAVVVDGVKTEDLRKGPGLYPQGSLPGVEGNIAIAGHRTTYGAWFRHLDNLSAGDQITISAGSSRIIYEVEKVFTVAKNDWSVIDPTPYPALTLTTCDPPGSAQNRLIVRARQTDIL